MADPTRILILDDHQVFAESLGRLLADEDDLVVVRITTEASVAVDTVRTSSIDVAILDIEMPEVNGIEVTHEIKRHSPTTQVLILSAHSGTKVMVDAVKAGCSGFLSKDRASAEVVSAVRSIAAGEITLSPAQLAGLLPALGRPDDRPDSELTPRELEVLKLVATGRTNRAIGEELHLSENTIRNYVHYILGKLDAHSKLEAVAKARDLGILLDG
jgi:DNA-binding NarL/FixJ family response regulator